jgi:predicted ester cyclase
MPQDDQDQLHEHGKAVARNMLAAWNKRGHTFMVDELMSPGLVSRYAQPLVATRGQQRAHVESEVALPPEGLPDQRFDEEILLTEGDLTFVAWNVSGTNRGELYGRKPTGKYVTVHGADVLRVAPERRIAEHWHYYSKARVHALARLGLLDEEMQQLLLSRGLLGRGKPSGVIWGPNP